MWIHEGSTVPHNNLAGVVCMDSLWLCHSCTKLAILPQHRTFLRHPPHPRGDAFARTTARLPCITSQTPDALPSRHMPSLLGWSRQ